MKDAGTDAQAPLVASRNPAAACPCWWKRGHTAFLVALIALNVGLNAVTFPAELVAGYDFVLFFLGCMFSQLALIGLWLTFGGLSFVARFIAVAAITGVGSWCTAMGLARVPHFVGGTNSATFDVYFSVADSFLPFWQTAGTIVLAEHALLLPLRSLLGWRIDFDSRYHALQPNGWMQLGLSQLIAYVAASALPFALWRSAQGDSGTFAYSELVIDAAILATSAFLGTLPIAVLVTARLWPVRMRLLVAIVFGVLLTADLFLLVRQFKFDPDEMLPFILGTILTVVVNLSPLRYVFGLHLFSVAPTARSTAEFVASH